MGKRAGGKNAGCGAKSSGGPGHAAKRSRCQAHRRDLPDKVERFMVANVYGKLPKKCIERTKVNGKLIREAIAAAYVDGDLERLGPKFIRTLLDKYGVGATVFDDVTLPESAKADTVSDNLVNALEVATSADNGRRTSEPLFMYLQSNTMCPTELLGVLSTIAATKAMAAHARQLAYVEIMKCLLRNGIKDQGGYMVY
jgi:hypothetical protein